MNLTQFEKEKVFAPFLGSTLNSINGLDQLGLNLTSERIFDFLLPGLNNVTNRIRYYSFYCWFFEWYADNIKIVSSKEQMKYLRRAEFLLALIAAQKGQGGIPGITKANEVYQSANGSIDLDAGTYEGRGSTEGSYWKNTRGVLGQYYISSIKQIGVLNDQGDKDGVYVRTDFKNPEIVSGADLSKAFKENIGKGNLEFFVSIVQNKTLKTEQLEILGRSFNMLEVPTNSKENELLTQMLLGLDKPKEISRSFFRRNTIINLLQILNKPENELRNQYHLPLYAYQKKIIGESEKDQTLTLWWLFMLEQYWSFSATSILKTILDRLNEKSSGSWVDLEDFIDDLSIGLTEAFKIISKETNTEIQNFSNFKTDDLEEFEILEVLANKPSYAEQLVLPFFLIHKIINANRLYLGKLTNLSKKYNLFTPSSFLKTSRDLIEYENIPLQDFIKHFLRKYIFYRHHFVSLKKMNGGQSTAKFILEEGRIRYIDSFNFDLTSPRIHNVYGFLEDLKMKNQGDFSLTKEGLSTLTKIK
jgi:hypothetical protein